MAVDEEREEWDSGVPLLPPATGGGISRREGGDQVLDGELVHEADDGAVHVEADRAVGRAV